MYGFVHNRTVQKDGQEAAVRACGRPASLELAVGLTNPHTLLTPCLCFVPLSIARSIIRLPSPPPRSPNAINYALVGVLCSLPPLAFDVQIKHAQERREHLIAEAKQAWIAKKNAPKSTRESFPD